MKAARRKRADEMMAPDNPTAQQLHSGPLQTYFGSELRQALKLVEQSIKIKETAGNLS